MTDEEDNENAYEDYITDRIYDLWEAEKKYKNKPSLLKLIHLWQDYRYINRIPPEWLLQDIDKYLETQREIESGKRKKEGHQMSVQDYFTIKNAPSPSEELKEYAKRERLASVNTASKRKRAFEKRYPMFKTTQKKEKK